MGENTLEAFTADAWICAEITTCRGNFLHSAAAPSAALEKPKISIAPFLKEQDQIRKNRGTCRRAVPGRSGDCALVSQEFNSAGFPDYFMFLLNQESFGGCTCSNSQSFSKTKKHHSSETFTQVQSVLEAAEGFTLSSI